MHRVFFDMEWTSWEGAMENNFSEPWQEKEIIQIGALKVDTALGLEEVASLNIYVKPKINPELSSYITELTGISQSDIDSEAIPFPDALGRFADFTEGWSLPTYSWGDDWTVLKGNCDLQSIDIPESLDRNMNDLRGNFRQAGLSIDGVTSGELHRHFGLDLELHQHDALDDVRSMVAVLAHLIASDSQRFEKLL